MQRREFITLLGGAAVAWPRAAHADRMRRVGVLEARTADDREGQARLAAFLQGLQELGWTDGRNVRIDHRWAAADADEIERDIAAFAREANGGLIVTASSGAVARRELGSRLIKSTIQERRRGRQRPSNFAPACRIGLRCA